MANPKREQDAAIEQLLAQAARQIADEQAEKIRQRYQDAPEVEFSPAFNRKMEQLIAAQKKHCCLIRWNKVAKRAAMILVVFATALAATLSVKGVRARLYDYFVSRKDAYTEVRISAANGMVAEISQGDYHYEPDYLPAGFRVTGKSEEFDFFYSVEYSDEKAYAAYEEQFNKLIEKYGSQQAIPEEEQITYQGPWILFEEQRSIAGSVVFDTENASYKELEISGSPAYLTIKNGKTMLIWDNGDRSFYLYGNLTESEAVRMANSLVRVEE
ncbi:MAG TPA: DUF4367 domain-containing protein [Candidatus Pygmaiobacter gallistercoris]|nr:DUF4367 domain-containing protein [Candidatus Pygmaiobacter gallistercoris]